MTKITRGPDIQFSMEVRGEKFGGIWEALTSCLFPGSLAFVRVVLQSEPPVGLTTDRHQGFRVWGFLEAMDFFGVDRG